MNGLAENIPREKAQSAQKQLQETFDDLNDDLYDEQDVQFIDINMTKIKMTRMTKALQPMISSMLCKLLQLRAKNAGNEDLNQE